MGFERFTESGRGHKPKLSIRSIGQLGLNQGAIKKFKLEQYQYVVLFYDRDNKKIGIKLVQEDSEEGVCRIHVRNQTASIPAKSFLDYYDIPYEGNTRKYDVYDDKEEGMLIADISEEKDN